MDSKTSGSQHPADNHCNSIYKKKSCLDSYQSFDLIGLASNQGIGSFQSSQMILICSQG